MPCVSAVTVNSNQSWSQESGISPMVGISVAEETKSGCERPEH